MLYVSDPHARMPDLGADRIHIQTADVRRPLPPESCGPGATDISGHTGLTAHAHGDR